MMIDIAFSAYQKHCFLAKKCALNRRPSGVDSNDPNQKATTKKMCSNRWKAAHQIDRNCRDFEALEQL